MSEYWKSTPKYWCKYCKIFVRDTKLEKQNHEATPRHQGNLKRSLRDLHRGNERDEREKQRAIDEVARLDRQVPSLSASARGFSSVLSTPAPPAPGAQKATLEEKKRQIAQLAEMGIAIPEEYRQEMAMAGDWQITAVHPLDAHVKGEGEVKSDGLNFGVRKRPRGEGEEQEEGEEREKEGEYNGVMTKSRVRRVWGSSTKTYPGREEDLADLDSLLSSTNSRVGRDSFVKSGDVTGEGKSAKATEDHLTKSCVLVKSESSAREIASIPVVIEEATGELVQERDNRDEDARCMFKKRKPKVMRQR